MRPRHGVTLIELLVALVLLTVGLGALAGTTSVLIHDATTSRRSTRAALIARSRLERLRMDRCTTSAGVEQHGGITERWAVTTNDRGATAVVDVGFADRARQVEQRYRSRFAC